MFRFLLLVILADLALVAAIRSAQHGSVVGVTHLLWQRLGLSSATSHILENVRPADVMTASVPRRLAHAVAKLGPIVVVNLPHVVTSAVNAFKLVTGLSTIVAKGYLSLVDVSINATLVKRLLPGVFGHVPFFDAWYLHVPARIFGAPTAANHTLAVTTGSMLVCAVGTLWHYAFPLLQPIITLVMALTILEYATRRCTARRIPRRVRHHASRLLTSEEVYGMRVCLARPAAGLGGREPSCSPTFTGVRSTKSRQSASYIQRCTRYCPRFGERPRSGLPLYNSCHLLG